MKRLFLLLGSVLSLFAGTVTARAQASAELEAFQQAAGDRSILFRGMQATRYTFLANGHPY